MRDRLVMIIKQFLSSHLKGGDSVVVGFSGGPDSLALYHLLRAVRIFFPFTIHLAHVDHGWREESSAQAEKLKKEALDPFHLHTLEPMEGSNLEDRCRNERLSFFSSLYKKVGASALFLGHHKDDMAETVLKRVFEGGNPVGLRSKHTLYGMRVLRPLLGIAKKELVLWNESKGLTPILDPTNRDTKYLRARFREELIPQLEKSFGKNITNNLAVLGDRFAQIEAYLSKKVAHLEEASEISHDALTSLEDIELRHLIGRKSSLSRDAITTLIRLLRERRTGKVITDGSVTFEVKREGLLIKN